jgi:hypothetical protein
MANRVASASVGVVAIASISVVGEAVPPYAPEARPIGGTLEVTPTELSFGHQAYGTRSAAKQVTLRSLGGPTEIASIRLDGSSARSFEIVTGGGAGTLAAGDSQSVALVFSPSQWRPGHDARLMITSGQRVHSVRLYGAAEAQPSLYAVQPSGTPPTLDFGSIRLGLTSRTKLATFRNIGPASYRPTRTELGPRGFSNWHPQDFRVVHSSCSRPVGPGATCAIGFAFRPTGADQRLAEYELVGGRAAKYVKLRGWGSAH